MSTPPASSTDPSDDDINELRLLFERSKAYRTYDLVIVDGQPQFILSELDEILHRALDEAYGRKIEEDDA